MAITNGYATLDQIKVRLDIDLDDEADDPILESIVEAISRSIDEQAGRRFWVDDNDVTKYFETDDPGVLFFSGIDLVSITTLKTDEDGDGTFERTWSSSDYLLYPLNAAADSKPYGWIETAPAGNYAFPTGKKAIEISGKFGYPAVPKPIKEATLLQSERLWKRKDAIFGIAGSGEMGQMTTIVELDPDVRLMVFPFRKVEVFG